MYEASVELDLTKILTRTVEIFGDESTYDAFGQMFI